jgi:hypothetical protein
MKLESQATLVSSRGPGISSNCYRYLPEGG